MDGLRVRGHWDIKLQDELTCIFENGGNSTNTSFTLYNNIITLLFTSKRRFGTLCFGRWFVWNLLRWCCFYSCLMKIYFLSKKRKKKNPKSHSYLIQLNTSKAQVLHYQWKCGIFYVIVSCLIIKLEGINFNFKLALGIR